MCLLKVFWNSGMEKYWVLIYIYLFNYLKLAIVSFAKLLDERNCGQLMTITSNLDTLHNGNNGLKVQPDTVNNISFLQTHVHIYYISYYYRL